MRERSIAITIAIAIAMTPNANKTTKQRGRRGRIALSFVALSLLLLLLLLLPMSMPVLVCGYPTNIIATAGTSSSLSSLLSSTCSFTTFSFSIVSRRRLQQVPCECAALTPQKLHPLYSTATATSTSTDDGDRKKTEPKRSSAKTTATATATATAIRTTKRRKKKTRKATKISKVKVLPNGQDKVKRKSSTKISLSRAKATSTSTSTSLSSSSLSSFEQRWNDKFIQLQQYQSLHGHCNVPQYYSDNPALGRWVHVQRLEYTPILRPILYNYQNRNWSNTNFCCGTTSTFPNISPSHNELNMHMNMNMNMTLPLRLEQTLQEQCSIKSANQIRKLNSIGFVWDVKEDIWMKRVQDLIEFQRIYGHVRVPQRWSKESEDEVQEGTGTGATNSGNRNGHGHGHGNRRWRRLGLWVRNQRAQYKSLKNGSSSTKNHFLTEVRIGILEDIGFCWDVQESIWLERYESLKDFQKYHGHLDVPCFYDEDPALARWVMQIRNTYREMSKKNKDGYNEDEDEDKDDSDSNHVVNVRNVGGGTTNNSSLTKLTPERIKLLNDIGFVWDKNNAYWWEQYRALVDFKRKYGHCSVPIHYHNAQLRNWVMNTRRIYRKLSLVSTTTINKDVEINIPKGSGCGSITMMFPTGLNEERFRALQAIDFMGM